MYYWSLILYIHSSAFFKEKHIKLYYLCVTLEISNGEKYVYSENCCRLHTFKQY